MRFPTGSWLRGCAFCTILSAVFSGPFLLPAQEKPSGGEKNKLIFFKPSPIAKKMGGNVKKIPLRVPYLPDAKDTSLTGLCRRAQFQAFQEKYPFIELSAFTGLSIPGMQEESRLMLAIAGGMAPDVLRVNFRMSDTYIQQGFLIPLDKYLERDFPGGISNYLERMPAPIRSVVYREGPVNGMDPKDKHVWFTRGSLSVRVLHWRKDLFREAGLDPDRPPKDWAELYEYARKLTDPANARYGFQFSGGSQSSWDFLTFLWSAGGDAVVQDKDGKWVAAYGSREAAKAMDFFVRLATEEWLDPDGNIQHGYTSLNMEKNQDSGSAKVAMSCPYLSEANSGGGADPALIGFSTFPPMDATKTGRTELNALISGIFSGIEGRVNSEGVYVSAEEIREAAWLFISYMSSDEAGKITADMMVSHGAGNTLSPDTMRKYGYEEYLKYFPETFEKAYNDAMENGVPEPYGRNCQLIYIAMTKPMDKIIELARNKELPDDEEERLDLIQNILKTSADQTTVQMMGSLTKEERAYRNRWAVVAAIIILAIFCTALYRIWQTFSPKDVASGRKRGWEFSKKWGGYMIMLPALISILIWIYIPMISGSKILFQDFHFVGESQWVGLNNLADVLFSADWWISVLNTLRYMLIMLAFGFLTPIILAILLQEVSCCKLLYRTLFYLPAVMSGLVVIFMWRLFYGSGPTGVLNQVVQSICDIINFVIVPIGTLFRPDFAGISFEPIAWLEDSKYAMFACILPSIWAGAGPGCLIYLAALKGVPDDIYEAAEIDGANFFMKIWHVTLPTLKALIIINFVGAFIAAAQSGGNIMVMTFGRANTEVAELHIFKEAYTNLRFGTAIAMAWILGVTTLLFTIQNLKRLSKMEFKTTGK